MSDAPALVLSERHPDVTAEVIRWPNGRYRWVVADNAVPGAAAIIGGGVSRWGWQAKRRLSAAIGFLTDPVGAA